MKVNGSKESEETGDKSTMGILVHPLSFLTGGVIALVVYFLAQSEYTKANAQNAVNWYISLLGLFIVTVIILFLGVDEIEAGGATYNWGIIPEPFNMILMLFGMGLMFVLMFAYLATLIFTCIATIKAMSGTIWKYPFSWSFIDP